MQQKQSKMRFSVQKSLPRSPPQPDSKQLSPGGGLQRPHAVPKSSCKSPAKKHELPSCAARVASLIRNSWAKEAAAAFTLPR